MRDRDDEFDLDESDDLDDEDEDEPGDTMPCPHCLGTIYDDSERCPHCGNYLSREDSPRRPPWWVIVGVGLCLVIVFRWIIKLH
jgi:uncharacterized protein (DUF983 family)